MIVRIYLVITMSLLTSINYAADYVWDPQGPVILFYRLDDPANYKGGHTVGPGSGDRVIFDGANDKYGVVPASTSLQLGELKIDEGYTGQIHVDGTLKIGNPQQFTTSYWRGGTIRLEKNSFIIVQNGDVLLFDGTNVTNGGPLPDFGTIKIEASSEIHFIEKNANTTIEARIHVTGEDGRLQVETGTKTLDLTIPGPNSGRGYILVTGKDAYVELSPDTTQDMTILKANHLTIEDPTAELRLEHDGSGVVTVDSSVKVTGEMIHESGNWKYLMGAELLQGAKFRLEGTGSLELAQQLYVYDDSVVLVKYSNADLFTFVGECYFGGSGIGNNGFLVFDTPENPNINSGRHLVLDGDQKFLKGSLTVNEYFEESYSSYSSIQITGDIEFEQDEVDFKYNSFGEENSDAAPAQFITYDGERTGDFDNFFNGINPLSNTHNYNWDNQFNYGRFWTQVKP